MSSRGSNEWPVPPCVPPCVPPPPTPEPPLVHDLDSFKTALGRLRAANDSLMLTTTRGLKLVIRNDPEADPMGFDLAIATDEDETILRATENELDAYDDGNGCVVMEEIVLDSDDAWVKAMDSVNRMATWSACPCGSYFIKDHAHLCYYCDLTKRPDEHAEVFCPICHDAGYPRWMITVPCCSQLMHRRCRDACRAAGHGLPTCPLCRADWSP